MHSWKFTGNQQSLEKEKVPLKNWRGRSLQTCPEKVEVCSKRYLWNHVRLVCQLEFIPELLWSYCQILHVKRSYYDISRSFVICIICVLSPLLQDKLCCFLQRKRIWGALPPLETPWGAYRAVRSCSSPTLVRDNSCRLFRTEVSSKSAGKIRIFLKRSARKMKDFTERFPEQPKFRK